MATLRLEYDAATPKRDVLPMENTAFILKIQTLVVVT